MPSLFKRRKRSLRQAWRVGQGDGVLSAPDTARLAGFVPCQTPLPYAHKKGEICAIVIAVNRFTTDLAFFMKQPAPQRGTLAIIA
jgi:hypothetical protein